MPNEKPLVIAALICDDIIVGADGVVSLIRVVDRFTGRSPKNRPPNAQLAMRLKAFFAVKAGDLRGEYEFTVAMRKPDGTSVALPKTWKVHLDGGETGANLRIEIGIPVTFGLHWLDLIWKGETLASTPFRLEEGPDATVEQ